MTSGEGRLAQYPVWYNVTQRSYQVKEKVEIFAEWSCNSTDVSESGTDLKAETTYWWSETHGLKRQ